VQKRPKNVQKRPVYLLHAIVDEVFMSNERRQNVHVNDIETLKRAKETQKPTKKTLERTNEIEERANETLKYIKQA